MYIHCASKRPLLICWITLRYITDCNNFWRTESWWNFTSEICELAHLTWIMSSWNSKVATISRDWCRNGCTKYLSGNFVSGWLRHGVTDGRARWIIQLTNGTLKTGSTCRTLNNSSDAACWIVDHTHNSSTGSCQNHPLITGEDYYNFGELNIADKTR